MIDLKHFFLSPIGRVGRRSYANGVALLVATDLVLGLVPFFGAWLALAAMWPFACLTAKRFHDAGRSAWPVSLVSAFCLGLGAFSAMPGTLAAEPDLAVGAAMAAGGVMLMGGIATVAVLGLLVWAALKPGTPGPNWFGDPEMRSFDPRVLLAAQGL